MDSDEKENSMTKALNVRANLMTKWKMSANVSDASLLTYAQVMDQYSAQKNQAKNDGVAFELWSDNKNTRGVFATAIRRDVLDRLLLLSQSKTKGEYDVLLAEIKDDLHQVEAMLKRSREETKSKKSTINFWIMRLSIVEKYFPNWRDRLQARMANSKYAGCVAVQRVTGCRTEELVLGATVTKVAKGEYCISINTAKQRAANPSNRVRVIKSNDTSLEPFIGLVKLDVPASLEDTALGRARAVAKAKNNYKQAMSNASKRLFKVSITPKSFRSSMASDVRAAGASTVDVAEFLGHASTACANRYTRGLNARGKARSAPAKLESARVKVQSKPISTSLQISRGILAPKDAFRT